MSGKDSWPTKFVITNSADGTSKICTLTPKEFINRYCQTRNHARIEEVQRRLNLTAKEAEKISGIVNNPKEDGIYARGIEKSFCDMMRDFAEYCRYYLEEVEENVPGTDLQQENQKQPEGAASSGPKIIEGGMIEQKVGQRTLQTAPKQQSHGSDSRKSEVIPYEKRQQILLELNPEIVVNNDIINEDGKVVKGIYHTYIYPRPQKRDGYLLIAEPVSGDKATRVIYIPDEKIRDFLINGQELNDKTWSDIVRYYVASSLDDFREESNTYEVRHNSAETYFKTIKGLLNENLTYARYRTEGSAAISVYHNLRIKRGEDFMNSVIAAIRDGKITQEDMWRVSGKIRAKLKRQEQDRPTQGGPEL